MDDIKFIAHRGNGPTSLLSGDGRVVPSEFCPENTLKAFREAVRQGADGIEFDVHLTKDGEVVVIHDDELNRNVEGARRAGTELGRVSEKTLAEVKQYNVGQGEAVPTLRETLDFFVAANAARKKEGLSPLVINPELKGKNIAEATAKVFNEYIDKGLLAARDVVFCSFEHEALAHLKTQNPHLQISPSLRTKNLFGDTNVILPGWHTKEGAEYTAEGLGYLRQYHRDNKCAGMDPVLWDIYKPLIDMAKEENFALYPSTSDLRVFDERHLVLLLAASRDVPIYFKTDEPGKARDALKRLLANVDDSLASNVQSVVSAETLTESPPPANPIRAAFCMAKELLDHALTRPISQRPTPYSGHTPAS